MISQTNANTQHPLAITISLFEGRPNSEYFEWNVSSAAREIVERARYGRANNIPLPKLKPHNDITLSAYNLHKEALRNRGMTDTELAAGDEKLVTLIQGGLA